MKFTVNPVRCYLVPPPQDRCRSQTTRRGDTHAISADCSHHAVAGVTLTSAKGPRHAGCSAGTPEERVDAGQSDRASGPAAGVRGRCADRRAPRQVIGHTPQSCGHLTPGERVEGGQVVEQRRGRHFRLGHGYLLVSMRGLTTPLQHDSRKALTASRPSQASHGLIRQCTACAAAGMPRDLGACSAPGGADRRARFALVWQGGSC